ETRLAALVEAGLDHMQLSFQGAREETANEISGAKSHTQKLRVLDWLRHHHLAVTLNFVIHRRNIDQLEEMLALAESSCATRIEFANVQYYGWAFANRENLLPTREQFDRSVEFLKREQERLQGRVSAAAAARRCSWRKMLLQPIQFVHWPRCAPRSPPSSQP